MGKHYWRGRLGCMRVRFSSRLCISEAPNNRTAIDRGQVFLPAADTVAKQPLTVRRYTDFRPPFAGWRMQL